MTLSGLGDVDGAGRAYEQAVESGHREYGSAAAYNLGLILLEQGDGVGARVVLSARSNPDTTTTVGSPRCASATCSQGWTAGDDDGLRLLGLEVHSLAGR